MANIALSRNLRLLAVGLILGGLLGSVWSRPAHAQRENAPDPSALQTDVTRLKDIVPPASHPMVDVGYHTVNLWFAAQKKNWPLATYYLGETRNRMRWEVRLNPAPKGPSGEPVDMKATQDGIENGTMNAVKQAIDKKDAAGFTVAYKHLLEDCYSCHKALGRPYLRLMVPVSPGQSIINNDPAADWPN